MVITDLLSFLFFLSFFIIYLTVKSFLTDFDFFFFFFFTENSLSLSLSLSLSRLYLCEAKALLVLYKPD